MSNNFQILEYAFEAYAEIIEPNLKNENRATSTDLAVKKLNELSDDIAQQLQHEIRRALPSRVRVEVDIQFYPGSIVAVGIIILSFLQPIVQEAGKKALEKSFEKGFTRIIEFAVKRILSRNLRGFSLAGPLEVDVQPSEETIQASQSVAHAQALIAQTSPNLGYLLPLTTANTVLLIVLIIFATRLLAPLP
jgi:hypothetical protein